MIVALAAIFAVVVGGTAWTAAGFPFPVSSAGRSRSRRSRRRSVTRACRPRWRRCRRRCSSSWSHPCSRSAFGGWWRGGGAAKGRPHQDTAAQASRVRDGSDFRRARRRGGLFPRGLFPVRVVTSLPADHAFLSIAAVGMTLVIFSGGIDLWLARRSGSPRFSSPPSWSGSAWRGPWRCWWAPGWAR